MTADGVAGFAAGLPDRDQRRRRRLARQGRRPAAASQNAKDYDDGATTRSPIASDFDDDNDDVGRPPDPDNDNDGVADLRDSDDDLPERDSVPDVRGSRLRQRRAHPRPGTKDDAIRRHGIADAGDHGRDGTNDGLADGARTLPTTTATAHWTSRKPRRRAQHAKAKLDEEASTAGEARRRKP